MISDRLADLLRAFPGLGRDDLPFRYQLRRADGDQPQPDLQPYDRRELGQQSVFVAGTERTLRYQDIARLHDGDYFLNGKLYDANGTEVPVLAAEAH